MLTLEFILTEQEYLDYSYYTNWLSPHKRAIRIRYYLLMPFICLMAIFGVLYLFDGNKITTSSIIMALGATAILSFLLPFSVKSSMRSSVRKILSDPDSKNVLSKTRVVFSENGIFGNNAVLEIKYQWTAIKKKVVRNNCYLLYVNTLQAIVIPIRAFANGDEKKRFDDLLAEYLPLETEFTSINKF